MGWLVAQGESGQVKPGRNLKMAPVVISLPIATETLRMGVKSCGVP